MVTKLLKDLFNVIIILAALFILGWSFTAAYGTTEYKDSPALNINTMELHQMAAFNVDYIGGKDRYVEVLKVNDGWIYYYHDPINSSSYTAVFVHE